ncbi:MAG: hypothetical protein AB7F78_23535, partial [Hyphomicrobiaceae bacterium]
FVRETAELTRAEEAAEFIDAAIPVAVEQTLEVPFPIPPPDPERREQPAGRDDIQFGQKIKSALKERYDAAVESANNVWKGVCRLAFAAWETAKPVRDVLSKAAAKAAKANLKSIGVITEKALTAPFKWLEKLVTGKLSKKGKAAGWLLGGGGSAWLAGKLGWLAAALEFVRSVVGLG